MAKYQKPYPIEVLTVVPCTMAVEHPMDGLLW